MSNRQSKSVELLVFVHCTLFVHWCLYRFELGSEWGQGGRLSISKWSAVAPGGWTRLLWNQVPLERLHFWVRHSGGPCEGEWCWSVVSGLWLAYEFESLKVVYLCRLLTCDDNSPVIITHTWDVMINSPVMIRPKNKYVELPVTGFKK